MVRDAEQHKFVAWWGATVQNAGGDRQSKKALAGNTANGLPRKEAEHLTGMKHQRVSDLGINAAPRRPAWR
jgi:hypothetical protein